jgi:nucleotide-binding universal stress UspA family protein
LVELGEDQVVEAGMQTVLVGVDGSECANAALAFAADEATQRHARLRIIMAWDVPAGLYAAGFGPILDDSTFNAFREQAQAIVDEAVTTVAKTHPSVNCEGKAQEGQPAAVLLEEAADAALIVVGSRGLGGFASLLLGSTSQQVVHHAACPVVVVHAQPVPDADRDRGTRDTVS